PEQARRAAQSTLARVRLGEDPQGEKTAKRAAPSVADLIDAFIVRHVEKHCKPSTGEGYKVALAHLRREHGPMKAAALTRGQVAALHARLSERTAGHGGPYAANRFLAIVSKLFSWGIEAGLLPDNHVNPARRIKKNRERRSETFLKGDQLARLGEVLCLGETEGLPWQGNYNSKHLVKEENRRTGLDPFAVAAIRLLILTGARLREILDAQWQHVNFERGILFLPDSKTGRKPVYLSAPALEVLASLPRMQGNPHIIAGMKYGAPKADLK